MPTTLMPSSGNTVIPGYLPPPLKWPVLYPDTTTEFDANAPWPYSVIQATRAKTLPSFSTSGIPRPTTVTPNAGGVFTTPGPTTATPTAVGGSGGFTTLTNVKNPAIDARLQEILKTFDTVTQNTPEEFVNRLKAAGPEFTGYTQQDIGTLSDIAGPVLDTKLQALRAGRRAAVRSAADRALGDLTRILSLGRMGSSTGSARPVGASSYLQKLGLDKATEIETGAALDDAAQERADVDYLNQLRLGTIGKRGDLLQTDIARSLLPAQVTPQWFNSVISGLLPLTSVSNANTFYGLQSPTGGYVGESFGGLQSSRLQDLARMEGIRQFDVGTEQDAIKAARADQIARERNQIALLQTLLGLQ